jgi:hypothetical protein
VKVGDLIECPAGVGLITNTNTIKGGGYILVLLLGGQDQVVVYCDTLEVINESR